MKINEIFKTFQLFFNRPPYNNKLLIERTIIASHELLNMKNVSRDHRAKLLDSFINCNHNKGGGPIMRKVMDTLVKRFNNDISNQRTFSGFLTRVPKKEIFKIAIVKILDDPIYGNVLRFIMNSNNPKYEDIVKKTARLYGFVTAHRSNEERRIIKKIKPKQKLQSITTILIRNAPPNKTAERIKESSLDKTKLMRILSLDFQLNTCNVELKNEWLEKYKNNEEIYNIINDFL